MKYEFHVGDYVETKDGAKGYVKDLKSLWWVCTVAANGYTPGLAYSIIGASNNKMSEFFNRIGQYDFTKKDKSKIEPLCEEYTKSFPVCEITTMGYTSECSSIDIGIMGKKINELVETVNELRNKND